MIWHSSNRMWNAAKTIAVGVLAIMLSGCVSSVLSVDNKATQPIPAALLAEMSKKSMSPSAPILVRIFKQESELEIWKQDRSGRYALLKTYPMCRWSGKLGPKTTSGDRQAPEGFYHVSAGMLNPNSQYYLSFNLGYPNRLEAALGYSGDALMVHGACSSSGCYALTDEGVSEIYAVAREALRGGQGAFQVQAFPFRMTPQNMAKHRDDPNFAFWSDLKRGYDMFEVTRSQPKVSHCGRRYVFDTEFQGGEPREARAAEGGQVALPRELGAGDRGAPAEPARGVRPRPVLGRQAVQGGVDRDVDARQEEGGHRRRGRERQARVDAPFEAAQVGVGHRGVPFEAEQQRDVEVHALEGELLDRLQTRGGAGHLDEDVGSVQRRPQALRLGDGPCDVVRQVGRDLQRDVARAAVRRAVQFREQVRGLGDVRQGEGFVRLEHAAALGRERGDGVVVVVGASDRLLEDRRVRRHPVDAVLVDEVAELAAAQQSAAELVEVDRLAERCETTQWVHAQQDTGVSRCVRCRRRPSGRRGRRRRRRAAAARAAAVVRRDRSPRGRRAAGRTRCNGRNRSATGGRCGG